ncbi:MAG: hypothetical protein P8H03_11320 [Emcibacteraceae bacterium]|nr:hypothetical protein [Emcibacteraceae bacterium]
MSIKTFVYSGLKYGVAGMGGLIIIACSSGNSDDWPKMQADNLWQKLEQSDAKSIGGDEINEASLIEPPFYGTEISLVDIRSTLSEIELALPNRAENMQTAVDAYNAAPTIDKSSFWRGVEIENSRLNELTSVLRNIEFHLVNNNVAETELLLTRKLIIAANSISQDAPNDINLETMNFNNQDGNIAQ